MMGDDNVDDWDIRGDRRYNGPPILIDDTRIIVESKMERGTDRESQQADKIVLPKEIRPKDATGDGQSSI